MKQLFLFIIFLLVISAPIAFFLKPYYYKVVNQLLTQNLHFKSNEFDRKLLYRLYKPQVSKGETYPLIVTLHGAAERGDDNVRQIDGTASIFISSKTQRKYPAFVFIPQCPKKTQWVNTLFTKTPFDHYQQSTIPESTEMKLVVAAIRKLVTEHPIDTTRIYIGGFSMGASGTWDILSRYPELFSAAFVMSGVSDTSTAETIRHIPVWAFNGELDDISPPHLNKNMCEAITIAGGTCRLTIYKNIGHYCVHQALKEPGFLEWLFSQRKKIGAEMTHH